MTEMAEIVLFTRKKKLTLKAPYIFNTILSFSNEVTNSTGHKLGTNVYCYLVDL